MLRNINKYSFFDMLFYFVIVLYGFLIIFKANFGVIDDHTLINTLFLGKEIPFFIYPEIGRFFPLDAQELNIISIFSTSPFAFYLFNMAQFFIIVILFYKITLNLLGSEKKYLPKIAILFLIFTPGFVTAWFRLFVPERDQFFFLLLFLYFFIKSSKGNVIYILLALLFANLSLYYKEPTFIMIGSFAFFHFLLGYKQIDFKQKILDVLLIFSSIIFIVIYFFLVYLKKGDVLYGEVNINPLIQLIKILFNYSLNDPLIVFILLPLSIFRAYMIIFKKERNYVFDSLLFSSVLYFIVFIKLNMFSQHYLLPIYCFGLFVVVKYLAERNYFKSTLIKFTTGISLILIFSSSLPTGIHLISFYKNVPNNFQATLEFLKSYLPNNSEKVNVFLYGVNRNTGVEIYGSFIKYMKFKGISPDIFDIKTEQDDNGILPIRIDSNSPYTVLKQTKASKINSGDLIIITPYTTYFFDLQKSQLSELNKEYDLVFHADSFVEIPNISLKSLAKFLYRKFKSSNTPFMLSSNEYNWPIDFYVLKKK